MLRALCASQCGSPPWEVLVLWNLAPVRIGPWRLRRFAATSQLRTTWACLKLSDPPLGSLDTSRIFQTHLLPTEETIQQPSEFWLWIRKSEPHLKIQDVFASEVSGLVIWPVWFRYLTVWGLARSLWLKHMKTFPHCNGRKLWTEVYHCGCSGQLLETSKAGLDREWPLGSWPSKRLRISSGSPVWEACKISSTSRKASFTGAKLLRPKEVPLHFLGPNFTGSWGKTRKNPCRTANLEMSWETNLCKNYLKAPGAADRSPGITRIKGPAVGSDPNCWNCYPSLHLDLPSRGPKKCLHSPYYKALI